MGYSSLLQSELVDCDADGLNVKGFLLYHLVRIAGPEMCESLSLRERGEAGAGGCLDRYE